MSKRSWADEMDRAQAQHPEQFGMVLDDHGNPVATPSPATHPDEPHEFSTTCRRCGERGFLNISVITYDERVNISKVGGTDG